MARVAPEARPSDHRRDASRAGCPLRSGGLVLTHALCHTQILQQPVAVLVDRLQWPLQGALLKHTDACDGTTMGRDRLSLESRPTEAALRVADTLLGSGGLGGGTLAGKAQERPARLCLLAAGKRRRVTPDGLVLGRLIDDGGIAVPDARVSRRHARFIDFDDGIAVVDLGSTNGTEVVRGDERIAVGSEPLPLVAGDRVATMNGVLLADIVEDDSMLVEE